MEIQSNRPKVTPCQMPDYDILRVSKETNLPVDFIYYISRGDADKALRIWGGSNVSLPRNK